MEIRINDDTFFIFDLDDTLYPELDYLKSAYRHIADKLGKRAGLDIYENMMLRFNSGADVFQWILQEYGQGLPDIDLAWLLREYRQHIPSICLDPATGLFLKAVEELALPAGLITDGRSLTQRNKLKSLGIERLFKDIIISEEFGSAKPDERNYLHFEQKYPGKEFYFFGDNTSKDFVVPARLGWKTVCIRDIGHHIHPQDLERHPAPDYIIGSFSEIRLV